MTNNLQKEIKDIANIYDFKIDFRKKHFWGKFKDKVNWDYISVYQKLSEEFIEKFKDKVIWTYISEYQKLSE